MTTLNLGAGRLRSKTPAPEEPFLTLARRIVREGFGPPAGRPFAVRYWNGFTEPVQGPAAPSFTLLVRGPAALRAALLPPSGLSLAEAFLQGNLGLEGSLEAAVTLADRLEERLSSPWRMTRLTRLVLRLPRGAPREPARAAAWHHRLLRRRHRRARDASAVRYHYDAGNDFYRLWLDRECVYSCAYFPPGVSDLDSAQAAKLDYICRKLRLAPGERFLDIGCGWGGLVRHAARHYGVEAVGITLSPPQAELARRRIAEDGLGDCCRVEVLDYRDLPRAPAYHKVASVGMVEHVGHANLGRYFEAAFRALRPGGLFLNHGIIELEGARPAGLVTRAARWYWHGDRFLQRYVFPDGELPVLADVVRAAERAGFESRDLESLREHYVLTLRHWVRRLEARKPEAVALVGETRFRVWRLYLSASAHAFATGRIGLAQLLLSKPSPGGSDVPLTRHDLYAEPPMGR